jgi:YVTN family beta-propeller protein
MKRIFGLSLLLIMIFSCKKDPTYNEKNYELGGGVFILNEGNFTHGDGSLSFYSYDSTKIYNDIFYSVNGRKLGDVPYSMLINDDKAFIVVNNSNKIEIIDPVTILSKGTITGLKSPRYIVPVSATKAYVSSLYSDSITIVDLASNSITGYINIRRTSEAILAGNNKAFVTSWAGGHEVMVIDLLTNKVVDSVQVGKEPESMVVDRNLNLWVLCSGTYAGDDFAKLDKIDFSTNKIIKEYTFPDVQAAPTCLKIDALGQTLYYLDGGVRAMNINDTSLPASPIIPSGSSNLYKIAINPSNGEIFVTDVLDYSSRGYVNIYKKDGTFERKEQADIIPGAMYFKLRLQ